METAVFRKFMEERVIGMMRKLSFRLVLAIFAVFLLAGGAYALSEEQVARREPNIQAVDNTFGYIFIPSEYAGQIDNLDNLDKDGVLCSFLQRPVRAAGQGGFCFYPYKGCISLNCKDTAHIHFCEMWCADAEHYHG